MSQRDHDPNPDLGPDLLMAIDAAAARLWPALDAAARRERARQALGLQPLAPWADGRMVYVARREA